jgi:hypothetical protein
MGRITDYRHHEIDVIGDLRMLCLAAIFTALPSNLGASWNNMT